MYLSVLIDLGLHVHDLIMASIIRFRLASIICYVSQSLSLSVLRLLCSAFVMTFFTIVMLFSLRPLKNRLFGFIVSLLIGYQ